MKLATSFTVYLAVLASSTNAIPQRNGGRTSRLLAGAGGNSASASNQQSTNQATGNARTGGGNGNANNGGGAAGGTGSSGNAQQAQLSTASDGSTIIDMTANINNLPIRFKVSAPAEQFLTASGVPGAAAAADSNTTMGLNVLLHGDGGQSFLDFPNQAVQGNLMGVVALAPNQQRFWGGGQGLDRVDGAEHSAAVDSLIQDVLPQVLSFNPASVFFTGVSGGSLMLSGFFVPQFMTNYRTGVELNCGALRPQVDFVDAAETLANTRIHFQSTQQELEDIQGELPKTLVAYEQLASEEAGLSDEEIGALMTVDNSPVGGHCEFDEQDFVSGVQLMSDNYAVVMQGGDGNVQGIGVVTNSIVGNENLQFQAPAAQ